MKVIDRFLINYLPVYLLEASDVIRYRTTSLFDDICDADPENKTGRNKLINGFTKSNKSKVTKISAVQTSQLWLF